MTKQRGEAEVRLQAKLRDQARVEAKAWFYVAVALFLLAIAAR